MNQKRFNKDKVEKQQISIILKKNKRLKAVVPADNEEMNFLFENNLKILKVKDQLQASQPSHDLPLMTFS